MLFNSPKVKHHLYLFRSAKPPFPSPTQSGTLVSTLTRISLWKNTSISSAELLSWKPDVWVLFATTSLMMLRKLLLLLSYSQALTIATLSWLVSHSPWSAKFRVQNCAARLVVRAPPHVHITPILRRPHWFPDRARISYKIACLCFNAIISSTPANLSDLLHLYSSSRSLRSSADTRLLKIPLYKCKTKGDRAFSYFDPSILNSLSLHIRNATTIDTFNSALKCYLFNLQESD